MNCRSSDYQEKVVIPVDRYGPPVTLIICVGPTLFTIYIYDLEITIEARKLDVKVVKFADDTRVER